MPQLKAAKKAHRQSVRRRVVNDRWRVKMRQAIRAVTDAVTAGDSDAAQKALLRAQSAIDRATAHKILHRNTASRKKSSLTKAVTKTAAK